MTTRELKKVLQNMPAELEAFYFKYIGHVRRAIGEFFPRAISRKYFERVTRQVELFPQDYGALYEANLRSTQEYLDRGGKVLRPILAALCLEAYGSNPLDYLPLLGAIEVMEDSSIIMDDYIDHSELRRGGPCAHRVHGFALADLSSCAAFALAHCLFYNNELNLPAEKAERLLRAVAYEHLQMTFGQVEELYWTESDVNTVNVEQYLQETIARCAFLSFRGPLRYAAIIADAPAEDVARLERIGEYLLIGYHIKGDDLDMSPDSDAWGKVAGEDITTGRRTLMINYLLQQAAPEDRATVIRVINSRSRAEADKLQVYELVLKYKVFEYTRRLAREYHEKTRSEIELLHVPQRYQELFSQFSDFSANKRAV